MTIPEYLIGRITDFDLLLNYLDNLDSTLSIYPKFRTWLGEFIYNARRNPNYTGQSEIDIILRQKDMDIPNIMRALIKTKSLAIFLEPTCLLDKPIIEHFTQKGGLTFGIFAQLLQSLFSNSVFYWYTFGRSEFMARYHKTLQFGFLQLMINCLQDILGKYDSTVWKEERDYRELVILLAAYIYNRYTLQLKHDLAVMRATDLALNFVRKYTGKHHQIRRFDINLKLKSIIKHSYKPGELIKIFHDNNWLVSVKDTHTLIALFAQNCSPELTTSLLRGAYSPYPLSGVIVDYRFVRLVRASEDHPRIQKVLRKLERIGQITSEIDSMIEGVSKLIKW